MSNLNLSGAARASAKGRYPEYPAHEVSNVRDLFLCSSRKFAHRVALRHKKDGRWLPITYRELHSAIEQFACGLAALGLRPGEGKIAIAAENRPEWAVSYIAAACIGVVLVPIDKDLRETEVYHILYLSGAQAFVGDKRHVEMAEEIRPRLPHLEHVINMDEVHEKGVLGFEHVKALGRDRIAAGRNDFDRAQVAPDDLLAILFTSGTMGNSKGVMLTHRNVAVNIVDAAKWVDFNESDILLSVLPLHHSYECTHGFLMPLYRGASIVYAESLRRVVDNMAETGATAMLGVPLLWHTMYKKIDSAMSEKGAWKISAAKAVARLSEHVLRTSIRRRIFRKVHEKLGGCARIFISGGAAIDPAVARGFRELGITFLQGYGLTESAPIIAVNRNLAFKDDAAGLPLPSVEVKIAEDGEILARGPNIMKGYYNNPEATREVLIDGWLYTGDLGYLDEEGFLYVQGRKKAVIVTPSGKKIYPEEVEAELLRSPYILECLVWGDSSAQPGHEVDVQAIVVPNTEYFISQGLEQDEAVGNARVEEILRNEVKQRCLNLAPYKRVTRVQLRYEEFEKTTTRKVKRYLYTGQPSALNGRPA